MAYAFLTLCMAGQGRGQEQAAALAGRSAGGLGGRDGQRQKRTSVRHYFVFAPGQRQAEVGVGVGGKGGQRQISVRH